MANNFANSINSNIGASNSGATNTLTVTNPSNTASSQALAIVTVGGATAGDPMINFNVSGVTDWTMGIDNSASDSFTISKSTALGTTDSLQISGTTGYMTLKNITTSTPLRFDVANSDTNAASNAGISSVVINGSAADPYLQVGVAAVSNYCWGIDNSDSDKLKINFDAPEVTPSTGVNFWSMTTAGERTMPMQPCVLATLGATTGSVTGDNTVATVVFATEVFDQNGDYNPATGIFTAPVTGKYLVTGSIWYSNVGATHTGSNCAIVATSRTLNANSFNPFAVGSTGVSFMGMPFTAIVDMTATDTLRINANVGGGTKTVQFYTASYLSISLLC